MPFSKSLHNTALKDEEDFKTCIINTSVICSVCDDVFNSVEEFEEHTFFHQDNTMTAISSNTGEVIYSGFKGFGRKKIDKAEKEYTANNLEHLRNSIQKYNSDINEIRESFKDHKYDNKVFAEYSQPQNQNKYQAAGIYNQNFYYCYNCGSSFNTKWWLIRHLGTVHNAYHVGNRFTPMSINLSTDDIIKSESVATVIKENDLTKIDTGRKPFSTLKVPETAPSLRKNVPPAKLNDEGRHKCGRCTKTYINSKDYITHYIRMHMESYSCSRCTLVFKSNEDLLKHRQIKHRFQCELCVRNFSSKDLVAAHVERDHLKESHSCKYCGRQVPKGILSIHVRRYHMGERQECKICHKIFRNKYMLTFHLRKHLYRDIDCFECGETVKRCYLSEHMRAHEGNTYECNICKRPFKIRKNAKVCERSHDRVNPFKCDICKKQFERPESLDAHKKRHACKRQYSCDECGKSFYRRKALYTHTTKHTPK